MKRRHARSSGRLSFVEVVVVSGCVLLCVCICLKETQWQKESVSAGECVTIAEMNSQVELCALRCSSFSDAKCCRELKSSYWFFFFFLKAAFRKLQACFCTLMYFFTKSIHSPERVAQKDSFFGMSGLLQNLFECLNARFSFVFQYHGIDAEKMKHPQWILVAFRMWPFLWENQ